ncbi:MAG: PorV/PorQ family protein [candidate division WOR-3 bacterium]|nr:PorV/PorQ family protein [candidate division WOR-3 bacterium]MCX7757269.1 PorV/PorQ family protein [candidate division WOR-3 bacterium]MDW7988250.1 PorV/PorQ family protein [candidate division WOR-3 bacterium]
MIQILLLCFFLNTNVTNAGVNGYLFLRINPDAYSSAMANSGLGKGFTKESNGFNFTINPAYLLTGSKIGITYLNYIAGVQIGGVSYIQSKPLPFLTSGGLGVIYLNSGSIKKTDEYGREIGSFAVSYINFALSGSYEVLYEKLLVGANIKFLVGAIDSFSSLGFAGDLGFCYQTPVKGLNLGAVVKNLGLEVKSFNGNNDRLPLDLGAGLDYQILRNIHIALGLHKPIESSIQVNCGGEFLIQQYLRFRIGYNTRGEFYRQNSSDILAGLSFGFGIRLAPGALDYSFIPMGSLGYIHNLTFSLPLKK